MAKKIAKKKVKKPVVRKKAPAKRKVVKKKVAPKKLVAAKKIHTKTEIHRKIAENVGITRKQVSGVLEHLSEIIEVHLKKGGVGVIKLEGLLKIERIRKPAKKARKGINPFTGEEVMFKAKPAHNIVKVRALKKLKEMIG
jgi:nucleoid DNA-binding protein